MNSSRRPIVIIAGGIWILVAVVASVLLIVFGRGPVPAEIFLGIIFGFLAAAVFFAVACKVTDAAKELRNLDHKLRRRRAPADDRKQPFD